MLLLPRKSGLVVGATSGIGRAAALLFANEGAEVAVAGRRENNLNELVKEIGEKGGRAIPILADVSVAADHTRMVMETVSTFGKLDFAFNNAGTIGNFVPMVEQSEEDWDRTIDVNLKAIWLSIRAQAKQMREQGRGAIVNTSSWLAVGALPGSTVYSASKAGIDGMVRSAALELASLSIRVNNINPGGIDTEMTREAFQHDSDVLEVFGRSHPIGRMGTPHETAELACFLLSDRAANITGQSILVDGGYTIPGQRAS